MNKEYLIKQIFDVVDNDPKAMDKLEVYFQNRQPYSEYNINRIFDHREPLTEMILLLNGKTNEQR